MVSNSRDLLFTSSASRCPAIRSQVTVFCVFPQRWLQLKEGPSAEENAQVAAERGSHSKCKILLIGEPSQSKS